MLKIGFIIAVQNAMKPESIDFSSMTETKQTDLLNSIHIMTHWLDPRGLVSQNILNLLVQLILQKQ